MSEIKHGTAHAYKVRRCRCDECKAANAAQKRAWKQRAAQKPPEEIPHGRYGYVNYDCRCEVCTAANTAESNIGRKRRGTAYSRAASNRSRERARARAAADPSLIPHGEYGGYTYWACRCPKCKEACAAYWRGYRARKAAAASS